MIRLAFRAMTLDTSIGVQAILDYVASRLGVHGIGVLLATDPETGLYPVKQGDVRPVSAIAPALAILAPTLPTVGHIRADMEVLALRGVPYVVDGEQRADHVATGLNVWIKVYENPAVETALGGVLTGGFAAGQNVAIVGSVRSAKRLVRDGIDIDWIVGGPSAPQLVLAA